MSFERFKAVLHQKAELFVIGAVVIGLVLGGIIGRALPAAPSTDEVNETMFNSDSTAIVQRTLTVKGEIKEIVSKVMTVVPSGVAADEQDANKVVVTISPTTSIFLYQISGSTSIGDPQKVEFKDLRAGDEIEAVMSQAQDGTVTATTVSAHRSI